MFGDVSSSAFIKMLSDVVASGISAHTFERAKWVEWNFMLYLSAFTFHFCLIACFAVSTKQKVQIVYSSSWTVFTMHKDDAVHFLPESIVQTATISSTNWWFSSKYLYENYFRTWKMGVNKMLQNRDLISHWIGAQTSSCLMVLFFRASNNGYTTALDSIQRKLFTLWFIFALHF